MIPVVEETRENTKSNNKSMIQYHLAKAVAEPRIL